MPCTLFSLNWNRTRASWKVSLGGWKRACYNGERTHEKRTSLNLTLETLRSAHLHVFLMHILQAWKTEHRLFHALLIALDLSLSLSSKQERNAEMMTKTKQPIRNKTRSISSEASNKWHFRLRSLVCMPPTTIIIVIMMSTMVLFVHNKYNILWDFFSERCSWCCLLVVLFASYVFFVVVVVVDVGTFCYGFFLKTTRKNYTFVRPQNKQQFVWDAAFLVWFRSVHCRN